MVCLGSMSASERQVVLNASTFDIIVKHMKEHYSGIEVILLGVQLYAYDMTGK